MLGKGAAYAQADADIRALSRRPASRTCRCRWPRACCPTRTSSPPSAARSYVLPEADVVMLIGARLNWLLSHGKGKTWGGKVQGWGGQKFIQIDISPKETDSNVRDRRAGRRRHRLVRGGAARRHWTRLAEAAGRMDRRHRRAQEQEPREDGRDAGEEPVADELPQRAQRGARHRQGASRRDPRQRRRQRARLHALHRRHVQAAQAPRRRHLGHHGHRHGLRCRGGGRHAASR